MALTITIPGAVETTTGSTAPAVLTVGVGAPGVGVPSGGTTGQVLQKLSGVSYDTGWLTLPADYITSVTAPLAVAAGVLSVDLSAYSTTAQAAALYYPLSGNPSAFLTASALTPYATIASPTFTGVVTIPSGALISGYLTTADAASTYYPLSGNPSAFLVAADIAGKADLASPTFTGVPLSTTAAVDTNTTQIATTAYVVGNGYAKLASPTFTGTPTLPTGTIATTQTALDSSTKLATTAFVTTADNLKANLASPTFTGTPTLPTGSIGVTQSPGDNTTALATTAFVTAAVPAIATIAQVYASTSATTATPPLLAPFAFNSGGYFPRMNFASTTSGTGASVGGADHRFEMAGPNVSTAGFAQIASESFQLWTAGTSMTKLKFSKPVWLSFRICNFSAAWDGDAQTEIKAFIGESVTGGVDPIAAAVGIFKTGGAGSFINLMVHNGTTLTKVATTTTFGTSVIDVTIYSNNGTVNLYLNGVLAATTSLGPTNDSNTNKVTAAVKATVTSTARQLLEIANIKVFAPQ